MAPHEHERRGETKTKTNTDEEESTAFFRGTDDDDYGGIMDEDDGVLLRGGPASASSPPRRRLVVVLTLARHADGVWITRLMSELRRRFSDLSGDGCVIRYEPVVVTLETLLRPNCLGGCGFEVDGLPEEWACVVNRVSDAADPREVKSCLAVLRAAEIWGIPVYNGPKAYSIGCNKFLHHQVFARAGLATPRSVPVRLGGGGDGESDGTETGTVEDELLRASKLLEEMGATYPFLVKPNSAGFGAGIEMFHSRDDLASYGRRIDAARGEGSAATAGGPSNDGMALLQEYLKPAGGFVYRVWFLDGRVQCATRREVVVDAVNGSDATSKDRSFTGGCAGGVCALPPRTSRGGANNRYRPSGEVPNEGRFRQQQQSGGKKTARVHAWTVPRVVEDEIGEILRVVGGDCHAGSVEFLVNSNDDDRRVYFDLNMLSTLPIHDDGSVGGMDGVWPEESFDPWKRLANSIASMVLDGEEARWTTTSQVVWSN